MSVEETRSTGVPPRLRRGVVLLALLIVLVGVGLLDVNIGRTARPTAPAVVGSLAAPVGSDSSSWYCAGSTGASGAAVATVLVTNTGPAAVAGTVTVSDNAGMVVRHGLVAPPHGQVTVVPSSLDDGSWLATSLQFDGGGVAVSQIALGPDGWSESPCASTALASWYFASGSTGAGATLVLTLYNPTSAPAVVDTTFDTTGGVQQPQPYEGIVVQPGQVVAFDVGTYVQDQTAVSAEVSTRSGRIVAEELQTLAVNQQNGMSLRLGAAAPRSHWFLAATSVPQGNGAAAQFDLFNPTGGAERVVVATQLPSTQTSIATCPRLGAVVTFSKVVAAGATWHLRTASSTRIAAGTPFALSTSATGRGIVVERTVSAPGSTPGPQWGATSAIGGGAGGAGSADGDEPVGARSWVVAAPGVGSVTPAALTVQDVGHAAATVRVVALVNGAVRSLGAEGTLDVPAKGFVALSTAALASVAGDPLLVESTAPVTVLEDLSPAGSTGVVAFGGIPLSSA